MANARIDWIQADKVSIRKAARLHGFDIEEINNFPDYVSKNLVQKTRAKVIDQLQDYWYFRSDKDFTEVKGVYIISLTDNIFVDYGSGSISPVLYIGCGRIRNRLSSHFEGHFFDFSRTLNDVNFKVYMGIANAKGPGETFVDAEFSLIEYFEQTYGTKPLLNKNSGTDTQRTHVWSVPIRLTHTPTTCSVSCRTAGKGSRCRNGDSIWQISDCAEVRTWV